MKTADAKRFVALEKRLSDEYGGFVFFALLLREGSPGRWDVVVSAPWLAGNIAESLPRISKALTRHLGPDGMWPLGCAVVIEPDDPRLEEILSAYPVEHGLLEVRDEEFFSMPIDRAFIITAHRPSASRADAG